MLRAKDIGIVALDTKTTSADPMTAVLCGFSLAVADNEACYVPIGHRDGDTQGGNDLFAPEAKLRAGSDFGKGARLQRFNRCWKTRACSRSART